jgi:hypothetical protein
MAKSTHSARNKSPVILPPIPVCTTHHICRCLEAKLDRYETALKIYAEGNADGPALALQALKEV